MGKRPVFDVGVQMTTLNQARKTYNQRQAAEAAITNEYITRKRVDGLEAVVRDLDRVAANHSGRIEALEARAAAGLGARLKWLFLGR